MVSCDNSGWESCCLLLNMVWQGCVCLMYSEYVKVFYTNVYNCVLGSVRVIYQKQFRHLYSFSVCINLYESETLRGHTDMICVIGLGDITKNCLKGFLSFFQKQPLIKVFVNLNFFFTKWTSGTIHRPTNN